MGGRRGVGERRLWLIEQRQWHVTVAARAEDEHILEPTSRARRADQALVVLYDGHIQRIGPQVGTERLDQPRWVAPTGGRQRCAIDSME